MGRELLPVLVTLMGVGERHLADGESTLTDRHCCSMGLPPGTALPVAVEGAA
jgi:hypothetical protein